MLNEEPYDSRTKHLLMGAHAAPSADLAPPGAATAEDMWNSARDGHQANQRFTAFVVRSNYSVRSVWSESSGGCGGTCWTEMRACCIMLKVRNRLACNI